MNQSLHGIRQNGWGQKEWAASVVIAAAIVLKFFLILVLGPATFPDSGLYLQLGAEISGHTSWFSDGHWGQGVIPDRLLRPYGYPLLVAAAQTLTGSAFSRTLIVLQSLCSLAVLALIAAIARRIIEDWRIFALVLALCATSGFLLFDLALLTDSLYCSLFIVVFCVLSWFLVTDRRPSLAAMLGVGGLWALSMSLRDVAIYHVILPMAGVIVIAWRQRLGMLRGVALVAALLLPVVAMTGLVEAWNLHRTGHAFYSITGAINWLWPSYNIYDRGLGNPFDCQDAICQTAVRLGSLHGMAGLEGVADALWQERHLDPMAFGALTKHHFLWVMAHHPLAFVASVVGNLQFNHLSELAFDPIANANELLQMHSAVLHRYLPGAREAWKALRGGSVLALPLLLLNVIPQFFALLALVAAMVWAPLRGLWVLCKGDGDRDKLTLMLFLAGSAWVFLGSYSLIHMEMRHALPAVPLILLVFGMWLDGWLKARKIRSYEAVAAS